MGKNNQFMSDLLHLVLDVMSHVCFPVSWMCTTALAPVVAQPGSTDTAPPKKCNKLLAFITDTHQFLETAKSTASTEAEVSKNFIDSCIPEESDLLMFGETNNATMPSLSQPAKKYLAVPAAFAPEE